MEKRFLFVILLAVYIIRGSANDNLTNVLVRFRAGYINPTGNPIHDKPQSPPKIPTVYQDGHTLSFDYGSNEYILQVVSPDDEDTLIFSDFIPHGTTCYQLPEYLEGEYIIRLIHGNICFSGSIFINN